VKSEPQHVTVDITVVVCVHLSPTPVTVIVYVPGVVATPTFTPIMALSPVVSKDELNETPTPAPAG
jgi:hypothetical protein